MKYTYEQKKAYVLQHAQPIPDRDNFYIVTRNMRVFKKLYGNLIANLIIPVGTVVHMPDYSAVIYNFVKMRATAAYVHSIAHTETKQKCAEGTSLDDSKFVYRDNAFVNAGFSNSWFLRPVVCVDGIHFFVTLQEALDY